jgi:hypothetical protein
MYKGKQALVQIQRNRQQQQGKSCTQSTGLIPIRLAQVNQQDTKPQKQLSMTATRQMSARMAAPDPSQQTPLLMVRPA